jgi:hypothetical protein
VQPGLQRYRKEREGILSAPLMPPKIHEVRAGEGVRNRERGYKLDVLRQRWEETRYTSIKQILVAYNREDCEALEVVRFCSEGHVSFRKISIKRLRQPSGRRQPESSTECNVAIARKIPWEPGKQ